MNEGDMVLFGKWDGTGYLEYTGYARRIKGNNLIDVIHHDGQGGTLRVDNVKVDEDAIEGEHYWRSIPGYTGGSLLNSELQQPLNEAIVWVSRAKEESLSDVVLGFVVGTAAPNLFPNTNLRVAFRSGNRDRIRTLVPEAGAVPCDDFWALEEPAPVYCDD